MLLSAYQALLFHRASEIQAEYADKAKQSLLQPAEERPVAVPSKYSQWLGKFLIRTGQRMLRYVPEQ